MPTNTISVEVASNLVSKCIGGRRCRKCCL